MIEQIKAFFEKRGILCADAIPFSLCRVREERRLARLSFVPESVILFAVPYLVRNSSFSQKPNLSLYARAKDYHLFFKHFSADLLAELVTLFPDASFAPFADASPIDEREAAAKAGLGVLGKHSLLITEKYASFVFLGEILTDLSYERLGTRQDFTVHFCEGCGRCLAACPRKGGECLSALTQKKGELTEEEACRIREGGLIWGCDSCQLACPHAAAAEETPIAFFRENLLFSLDEETLLSMRDEEFSERAFSWRGKGPLLRNLAILSEGKPSDK